MGRLDRILRGLFSIRDSDWDKVARTTVLIVGVGGALGVIRCVFKPFDRSRFESLIGFFQLFDALVVRIFVGRKPLPIARLAGVLRSGLSRLSSQFMPGGLVSLWAVFLFAALADVFLLKGFWMLTPSDVSCRRSAKHVALRSRFSWLRNALRGSARPFRLVRVPPGGLLSAQLLELS